MAFESRLITHLLLPLWAATLVSTSLAETLDTDFEFDNRSGLFELGNQTQTATFSGGQAKSIGVFSLYHSGTHAWMIDSGQQGSIDFNPAAEQLTVFFRNQTANASSTLSLLDASGEVVASFRGASSDWQEVNATKADFGAAIAKAVLTNQGPGYAVLDDLSYTATAASTGNRLEDPIPAPITKEGLRLRLKPVTDGLTAPNWAIAAPDDPNHLFVGDQDGKLWRLDLTNGSKAVFLDLSSLLVPLGISGSGSFDERGLLGFAFHPQFAENGLLYTYTSEPADQASDFSTLPAGSTADHRSVIREWRLNPTADGPLPLAPSQVRIVLTVDQPQFNHNAGALNFGPDGLLYIALGDGGGADDRDGQPFIGGPMVGHGTNGNGQNPQNPLGSLLRIDPQGNNAANGKYGIPAGNPFSGSGSALAEIYAYGFRNPFRFSFDAQTGSLYLADVGQNDIEEVNRVQAGGNYGWAVKEGGFRFDPNGDDQGFVTDGMVAGNFIDPIAQYDHDEGTAVIGGFVYRGQAIAALEGKYVFGDVAKTGNGDGRLFYLDGSTIREFQLTEREQPGFWVLGFGQDSEGELYVLGNATGVPFEETGKVYKLVANADFDFAVLDLPAVDVRLNNGTRGVYRAKLRLIAGSQPLRVELMEAARLSDTFSGDNASYDQSTGLLTLPFVDVETAPGNLALYSATLEQVPGLPQLTFELREARRLK